MKTCHASESVKTESSVWFEGSMTKACSEEATFGRMVDWRMEEREADGACAASEETNAKAEESVVWAAR